MKSQFARDVAIRVGMYLVTYLLVFVGNFYFCQWLYAGWDFEHVLDAMEAVFDLIVYSYTTWALVFTITPALIYFRKRKEPKSVLKVSSLICTLVMILLDACLVLLFLFG